MSLALRAILLLCLAVTAWAAPRYQADSSRQSTVLPPQEIPAHTRTMIEGTALVYVSDYFSFVGADAQGHVAFALDNNRGRDGEQYQAEHFLVLHDEHQGWIDIKGKGFYDNPQHQLSAIPDSPFFQFRGAPQSGLMIMGLQTPLRLAIEPLVARETRGDDERLFSMGSAAAVLSWGTRHIQGRVIHEYLVLKNANRLSRRFNPTLLFGGADFQGLYLHGGPDDDLYVHGSHGPVLQSLMGPLLGFWVRGGKQEVMTDVQLDAIANIQARGLFRWPTAWEVRWTGAKGPAIVTVTERDRQPMVNWLLGGFAMSIVSGELDYDGHHRAVYGFGEIIR